MNRYDSTTEMFTVPPCGDRYLCIYCIITSPFIVYRYDSTTGTFTVPSGGDGLYYFSVYLRVLGDESAAFDIEVNGEVVCEALSDLTESSSSDSEITSCSGVANVVEGICYTRGCSIDYRTHHFSFQFCSLFTQDRFWQIKQFKDWQENTNTLVYLI